MEIDDAAPLTITSDTAPETETPEVNDDGPMEGEKLDSAPAKTEEVSTEPKEKAKPKVTFDADQQEVVDGIRNKEVFKRHDTERELKEANDKLAEIEANKPKAIAPEVPAIPNPDDFVNDDEGLKAAHAARDKAIEERANFDRDAKQTEDNATAAIEKHQQEVVEKAIVQAKGYYDNAKEFGQTLETAQKNADLVGKSGMSGQVQSHIASDEKGPLITDYLVRNPLELDKINKMDPMTVDNYLTKELKPKLAGAVRSTNAPAPAEVINGGGTPEQEDPALLGAEWK